VRHTDKQTDKQKPAKTYLLGGGKYAQNNVVGFVHQPRHTGYIT